MDDFVDKQDEGRFELRFEGGVAFATYRMHGEALLLTHTEVPPAFSGRGIGSRLAEHIFEELRRSGRKAVIGCSFLADWLRRNPEYGDVIAH